MKSFLKVSLVGLLLLVLFSIAAKAADQNDWLKALQAANTPSFSADMVMTSPSGNNTSKIIYNKDKMRMEMAQNGQNIVSIVDLKSKVTYMMMDPKANSWLKMNLAETAEQMAKDMPKPVIKKLADEVVDNKPCEVSEYTYPNDGIVSTMWIWKGKNIPVQIISVYQGKASKIQYKNVEFKNFPADLFVPPAGAQIMDMSKMMQPGAGK